jgi:hypothetical protein
MMHQQIENPFRVFWNLGYRNLLPVVPPGAEIAPDSRLSPASLGKTPGVRGRDGLWRGANLHNIIADESDLDRWFAWGAGVGMKGDAGLFFVDVDHMDPDAAKRIFQLAKQHLGPSWPRVGQAPKFALPYRSTALVKSTALKFDCDPVAGKEPGLDIISTTPHCVVSGTHASTGQPYTWPRGVPAHDDLTEVTPEQVEAFLDAVCGVFPARSRQDKKDRTIPDNQIALRGDPAVLRSAMRDMPNSIRHFPDRLDYITMGLALKSAFGPDFEDEALELFHQWAGRWDSTVKANHAETVEKDWARMKGPYSLGADYIYNWAERLTGWRMPAALQVQKALDYFEPQPMDGEKKPKERKRVELLTDHDIQTRPDPQWLIDRHVPEDGLGILYGEPGAGKSFIALDLALHIATQARTWHGQEIKGADRGAVLYIAGEGAGDFKLRVAAWKKQNFMLGAYIPDDRFRALLDPLDFRSEEDVKALIDAIREANLPKLAFVVIDTVARATPGADENSSQDMGLFIRACDAVRFLTGAFVFAVHHPNKNGGLRGSTALLGAADVVFRFERKKGQAGPPFYGRLKCEKMKAGRDDFETPFRLDVVELGGDASSLVPVRVEETEIKKAVCDEATETAIHEAIRKAWDEGAPWSMAPQAKDRYAPRIVSSRWNVAADVAQQWLDLWLHGPEKSLEVAVFDVRSKVKGLRPVGSGSDASDGLSGSDGVFG